MPGLDALIFGVLYAGVAFAALAMWTMYQEL
jgi:hypothetical protein